MLFIQTAAMKTAKLENRASEQYHHDQQRASMARAINPSLRDLETRETRTDGRVPQPAMRAVERITGTADAAPFERRVNDEVKLSCVTVSAPVMSGAPVNLSIDEFDRLQKDDQTRIMRQVLAYRGARERIVENGSDREAFARELGVQRRACRLAREAVRDGKKTVINREQSKRDKKSGRPKIRASGTARFTKGPTTRLVATTGPIGVEVSDRRLSRGESDLFAINAVETVTA